MSTSPFNGTLLPALCLKRSAKSDASAPWLRSGRSSRRRCVYRRDGPEADEVAWLPCSFCRLAGPGNLRPATEGDSDPCVACKSTGQRGDATLDQVLFDVVCYFACGPRFAHSPDGIVPEQRPIPPCSCSLCLSKKCTSVKRHKLMAKEDLLHASRKQKLHACEVVITWWRRLNDAT